MIEIENEYNLSMENFLDMKFEFILDDCYVIQVKKRHKGLIDSNINNFAITWVKIWISMLFSFGIFRNSVYTQPFVRRFNIYVAIIKFWFLIAFIFGILIGYWTNNILWGLLAVIAISMLSYGGIQMLDNEFKSLRYFYYKKDTNGIWNTSSVSEISGMFSRRLIDYIFPFLYFGKRMKLLTNLANCNIPIKAHEIRLDKYLNNVMNDSERIYVYVENNFYHVEQ